MPNLANIAIGLIVVALLLVRQLQPRPARETSPIRLMLMLGAAGIGRHRRHLLHGTIPDGDRRAEA